MIEIYTDGSSRGNPGKGGFGVVILKDNELIDYISRQYSDVTNNRMELEAILVALQFIFLEYEQEECIIYSDSAYCVNICNQWIYNWAKNGWVRGKNEEIKNLDIIQNMYKYIKVDFPNFIIKKCAGHSNIIGNELADALASDNQAKFKTILKENNIKDKYDFSI